MILSQAVIADVIPPRDRGPAGREQKSASSCSARADCIDLLARDGSVPQSVGNHCDDVLLDPGIDAVLGRGAP